MITDAFVQEDGLAYDADSITVKLNKEDVTKDCKITVDGNKFKIETGKNITDEDKIEVTYNVTFSKEGEYTNTAIATSDNTNEDQATNVIEVTNVTPELSINKTSDKTEYAVGNTGIYTLTVKQTKADATAKKRNSKGSICTRRWNYDRCRKYESIFKWYRHHKRLQDRDKSE